MSQSQRTVRLFREMLRTGAGFKDYNFRAYALRRIAAGFRENQAAPAESVSEMLRTGEQELERLRRTVMLNAMYHGKESVMGAVRTHGHSERA